MLGPTFLCPKMSRQLQNLSCEACPVLSRRFDEGLIEESVQRGARDTWAVCVGLAGSAFYSAWKRQQVRDAGSAPNQKATPGKRPSNLSAAFDLMSWGQFVAASCFLVAAIVQTIDVFDWATWPAKPAKPMPRPLFLIAFSEQGLN